MLKHSLFVLVGLTIVGCSAAQNTRGQDAMWVAYLQCRSEGRVPANVQLIRVEPNGHGWYQTYSSSYGGADFERCITEKGGAKSTTRIEPAPPTLGP
jgi:opacity protein-like surface antigen